MSDRWQPLWWRDGSPMRFAPQWGGRGIAFEIGERAYRCMVTENRKLSRSGPIAAGADSPNGDNSNGSYLP